MGRHVYPCTDPDCSFCEDLAEQLADRDAEERAEEQMRDMEDRYEEEVFDQWGPQT